jgi:hypothetical protein
VVQIVDLPSSSPSSVRGWDGRLMLVDGWKPPLPTYHAGAVRVRALPAKGAVPDSMKDEILFFVEITPQPKTSWHSIVDLRIDKAVDENDQDLAPSLDTRSDLSRLAATGNGVAAWDAQTGQLLNSWRDIPVRLKSGDKPSGILKELRGVIAAQVQTEPEALVTVNDIFNAAGRTFVGEDGESLRLMEVNRRSNGDVNLRVELTDVSPASAFWVMRGGVMRPNRLLRRGLAAMDNPTPANLLLQDAAGQTLPPRHRAEEMVINGNSLARAITLEYHSGLSDARKLVYSGRRMIIIEIPFTLTDVPLP